jgi:hypothetical protein
MKNQYVTQTIDESIYPEEYDDWNDGVHKGYRFYEWGDGHGKMKMITYRGKTLNLTQWSEFTGMPYSTLQYRVKSGWDVHRIFTTPFKAPADRSCGPADRRLNQRSFSAESSTLTQLQKTVLKHAKLIFRATDPWPTYPPEEVKTASPDEYKRQVQDVEKQIVHRLGYWASSAQEVHNTLDAIREEPEMLIKHNQAAKQSTQNLRFPQK